MTYTLYIGERNDTHELDIDTIKRVVSARHDGFTVNIATGYWLGHEERTAVILIEDDEALIQATIQQLKTELEQDAIAYQIAPQLMFA